MIKKYRRQSMRESFGEFYRQNQTTQIRHITRLEALQVAIDDNLKKMIKNTPEKRVGIVAFNQDVKILGDGQVDPMNLMEQTLDSKENIKRTADRTASFSCVGADGIMNKLRDKLLK